MIEKEQLSGADLYWWRSLLLVAAVLIFPGAILKGMLRGARDQGRAFTIAVRELWSGPLRRE